MLRFLIYSIIHLKHQFEINGLPEDIEYDGEYLWVTVPHSDFYFSTGNMGHKIDIATNAIVESIEVGSGPQQIAFDNGEVFISRTFYDESFNTFHGATKIGAETTILNQWSRNCMWGLYLKTSEFSF